jgi:hypothetical protein
MGGAKRYPSIASYGDDGFRRLNPSLYSLHVLAAMKSISAECKWRSIADEGRAFTRKQPVGQISVHPLAQKYFASPVGQIISTNSRHPVPRRGAYHDRHERWDGMRWTRQRFARDGIAGRVGERPVSDHQASGRETMLRTAKSCGPDAPTLASSSRS